MRAAGNNRTETLKLLLSKPDVDLGLQNNYGWTAITKASYNNSVDCLKLLLLHPKCSKEIVEMKNNDGQTALMIAKSNRFTECENLLKSFNPINCRLENLPINTQNESFSVLMNSKPASDLSLEELFSEIKSLTSVHQEKEGIIRKHKEKEKKEFEEFDNKLQKIELDHVEELQRLEIAYEERKTKHNEDLLRMQASYRKESDRIEDMFSKGEARKKELQDIVQGSFGMMLSPPSQASTSSSAVPDCYSCFEKYRPRVKLWTCGSGHSVCGNCYDRMPNKICGICRRPITGRATDMEKMIMRIYNQD